MDVSIVIVSYNVDQYLEKCLDSIREGTLCSHEIIVVDNASGDQTPSILKSRSSEVKALLNATNLGFARANNQAMKIAQGRYVLMLNPDTVVLDGAIDRLLGFMESHAEVGVSGPKNLNPDLTTQPNCHHFPSLFMTLIEYLQLRRLFPRSRIFGREHMTYWDHGESRDVDWITGSSLMIRKDLLEACDFLDEDYFMYMEECDLSFRLRRMGFRTHFVPQAAVLHYGGQSSLTRKDLAVHAKSITRYLFETKCLFFKKNYGRIWEIILKLLSTMYFGLSLVKNVAFFARKNRKDRISEALAVLDVALGGRLRTLSSSI